LDWDVLHIPAFVDRFDDGGEGVDLGRISLLGMAAVFGVLAPSSIVNDSNAFANKKAARRQPL
jgi:hypothetical protein